MELEWCEDYCTETWCFICSACQDQKEIKLLMQHRADGEGAITP
jgi:hypothetical protein